jgi:superfamily II DNA/RNA helicase
LNRGVHVSKRQSYIYVYTVQLLVVDEADRLLTQHYQVCFISK